MGGRAGGVGDSENWRKSRLAIWTVPPYSTMQQDICMVE